MTVLTVPRPLTSLRSASRRSGIHGRVSGMWDSFVSMVSAHNEIPSGFGFRDKTGHLQRQKIGRLRRPSGLETSRPLRIWDDSRPGPESEFDLAQTPESFFVSRDKNVVHLDTSKVIHFRVRSCTLLSRDCLIP